jgi:amino acid adenylation domain-containing protein
VALVDDRRSLSFGELAARALHLAQGLGVGAGDRVVLCADNSVESVVAMFAVWAAHAVLVPVAPRDADPRLQRICAVARPNVILTDRRRSIGAGAPELALAEAINLGVGVPVREPDLPLRVRAESAYVIFTSGSTGEPKGVVVSHQAFSHALQAAACAMGFGSATRSLALLPMHFDGSFSGVFPVLARGGAVYVHRGPVCMAADFFRAFTNHGLTHVTMTPTYLRLLMDSPEWQDGPACSTLTTLALGGEVPPKAAIRRLWERLPDVKVFNRYGPTEATMAVSTLQITPDMLESEASIPIGVPHRGVDFRVIDSSGAPIEDERPGELYIGGAQLMLGYLDDPAATAGVLAPFFGDGRSWLKCGDVVRRDEQGRYVFVERVDNVVKRNGVRVGLAEIDAALCSIQGVEAAVCVKAHRSNGDTAVIAFVNARAGELDDRTLRRQLLRSLPPMMVPDEFHFVDSFPLAPGGKVDRHALLASIDAR